MELMARGANEQPAVPETNCSPSDKMGKLGPHFGARAARRRPNIMKVMLEAGVGVSIDTKQLRTSKKRFRLKTPRRLGRGWGKRLIDAE